MKKLQTLEVELQNYSSQEKLSWVRMFKNCRKTKAGNWWGTLNDWSHGCLLLDVSKELQGNKDQIKQIKVMM